LQAELESATKPFAQDVVPDIDRWIDGESANHTKLYGDEDKPAVYVEPAPWDILMTPYIAIVTIRIRTVILDGF
jgi:hypothetical protein